MTFKTALALRAAGLVAALGLLASCSRTVNVASRRGAYDAYLDIPARAQAAYAVKTGFYKQVMDATQSPDAEPYPALLADLQTMQRHVQDMTARRKSLLAFEGKFDQFAATHATVNPKQPADWAQFQSLDGEFQPLGQGMQVSLQGYTDASNDFDHQVQAASIAQLKVDDVRAEISGFDSEMDQAMTRMEAKAKEDRKALEFAYAASGSPDLLHQKAEILEKMDKKLFDIEAFQRSARTGANALNESLPTTAEFWTGPGMDDDGSGLAGMRAAHDGFKHRVAEFFDLSGRFDAASQPANAPAPGGPGQGPSGNPPGY